MISVLSFPSNNASVTNEMIFVVDEATKAHDETTYPNYVYIADIYVDSVFIHRMRAYPDPSNRFGIFDVSEILKTYAPEYGLTAVYSNLTENYEVKTNYQIKFGEEYSDTLYPNVLTDSARTCFRTYIKRPSGSGNVAITDVLSYMASAMPRTLNGFKEDYWFIVPFINNVSGQTITYGFDDGNGNLIGSTGTIAYTGAMINKILQMNFGFKKLAAVLGLTTSQQNSVRRLTFDNDYNDVWTVNYSCTKYPTITLAWLNRYGAYESYTFGLVSKKSNEINRKQFAQKRYRINASGDVAFGEDGVLYGSRRGFSSNTKVNLKLTSHLLTKEEYTWLADLFSSPDVYMYDDSISYFVPVMVKPNGYEYRTYLNSKLTPLEFDVEFSDDYNSQLL